jgi:hypothetical protein
VLAWRPDALIAGGDQMGSEVTAAIAGDLEGKPMGVTEAAWMQQSAGLQMLPCVQKGRIVTVPGALLASTSQHVVEAGVMIHDALARWGKP